MGWVDLMTRKKTTSWLFEKDWFSANWSDNIAPVPFKLLLASLLGYLAKQAARPLPVLFRFSAPQIGPSTIIPRLCFGRNPRKGEIKLLGRVKSSQVAEPRPRRFFTARLSHLRSWQPALALRKRWQKNNFLQMFILKVLLRYFFTIGFLKCFFLKCFWNIFINVLP